MYAFSNISLKTQLDVSLSVFPPNQAMVILPMFLLHIHVILTGHIESWTSLGIGSLVSRSRADINFRTLFRIVLTVCLSSVLSSLAVVERSTLSATNLQGMVDIWGEGCEGFSGVALGHIVPPSECSHGISSRLLGTKTWGRDEIRVSRMLLSHTCPKPGATHCYCGGSTHSQLDSWHHGFRSTPMPRVVRLLTVT